MKADRDGPELNSAYGCHAALFPPAFIPLSRPCVHVVCARVAFTGSHRFITSLCEFVRPHTEPQDKPGLKELHKHQETSNIQL